MLSRNGSSHSVVIMSTQECTPCDGDPGDECHDECCWYWVLFALMPCDDARLAWLWNDMILLLKPEPVPVTQNLALNLWVSIRREPFLSRCRVEMEPLGPGHFFTLVKLSRAPNIIVFCMQTWAFYLLSAKFGCTQQVSTRSALYWLRANHGIGFITGSDCGSIFRIEASKTLVCKKERRSQNDQRLWSLLAEMSNDAFDGMHFSNA